MARVSVVSIIATDVIPIYKSYCAGIDVVSTAVDTLYLSAFEFPFAYAYVPYVTKFYCP